MGKQKRNKGNSSREDRVVEAVRSVVDGSLLTTDGFLKHVPYIVFIALLALLFITNRYHAEKVFVKTEQTRKEIRELRSEKISVQSVLMSESRQQFVLQRLKEYGSDLQISDLPPYKIEKVKKD